MFKGNRTGTKCTPNLQSNMGGAGWQVNDSSGSWHTATLGDASSLLGNLGRRRYFCQKYLMLRSLSHPVKKVLPLPKERGLFYFPCTLKGQALPAEESYNAVQSTLVVLSKHTLITGLGGPPCNWRCPVRNRDDVRWQTGGQGFLHISVYPTQVPAENREVQELG